MITIKKMEKPSILVEKEGDWTNELMSFVNAGQKVPDHVKSRYRNAEIKELLLSETQDKCAYCESKITHIDHGDIEHIIPKSKGPEKTFLWENLTIGCSKCNQFKSDYYDELLPLLNPYLDSPENHILFLGPIPVERNGSEKAYVTIKRLKLDRPELIERRIEYMKKIQPLIREYERANNDSLRRLLLEDLLEYTKADKEFSSMVKHMLDGLAITA